MRVLSVTALLLLTTAVAIAADAPPMPKVALVRGTISAMDAKSITLKTESGDVTAPVSLMTRFATVEKRTMAQIKATDFIGVTAVPGKDGHLTAEEIHVIPLAGMGEGQYPWPHHPSGASSVPGSMTNGTVTTASNAASSMSAPSSAPAKPGSMTNATVTASGGSELTLSYHGAGMVGGKCEGLAVPGKPGCTGTAIVDVTPQTPIVAIVPWRRDMVKPGLYAVAAVQTDATGKQSVGSVTVEKGGVKPEF